MSATIRLNFEADSAEELARVLRRFTEAMNSVPVSDSVLLGDEHDIAIIQSLPAKPRGRPKKVESPEPVEPVASPAPAAVEVAAPAPVSVVAEAGAAASPTVTKAEVQAALIEVVKGIGREACVTLCEKYGAKNLSAIDPSHYASLLADARAALETV
jgi:hypothetical protein